MSGMPRLPSYPLLRAYGCSVQRADCMSYPSVESRRSSEYQLPLELKIETLRSIGKFNPP